MRQIGSEFLALAATTLKVRQSLQIPPGRCATCRDWPPTNVICDFDDHLPREKQYGTCRCGFRPIVIEIIEVEMPLNYLAPLEHSWKEED